MKSLLPFALSFLMIPPVFAEIARPALVGYVQLANDKEVSTQRGLIAVADLQEGDEIRFRAVDRGDVKATVSHVTRGWAASGNVPRLELDETRNLTDSGWGEDMLHYNGTMVLPMMAITGVLVMGPMQLAAMGCTFALANAPAIPFLTRRAIARAKRRTHAVWLTHVEEAESHSRMILII